MAAPEAVFFADLRSARRDSQFAAPRPPPLVPLNAAKPARPLAPDPPRTPRRAKIAHRDRSIVAPHLRSHFNGDKRRDDCRIPMSKRGSGGQSGDAAQFLAP